MKKRREHLKALKEFVDEYGADEVLTQLAYIIANYSMSYTLTTVERQRTVRAYVEHFDWELGEALDARRGER